jgi:hypothetical protein
MAPILAQSWWFLPALSLTLALLGLAAAEPPGGGDEPAEAVVQLPPAIAEAQQAKLLSAAARTAVNYVDAAALAVAAGDLAQAGRLLTQARQLLDQILGGIRERTATEPITVIPVLARVRVTEGGEVSDALAAEVQALEPLVLAGEQDRVLAGLQGVGVSLSYQYVGMPVQATSEGIDRATAALAAGDAGAAQAALQAIVQGLEARSLSIGPKPPPGSVPDLKPEGR